MKHIIISLAIFLSIFLTAFSMDIQEDIIPFNPATVTVKKINGSWKMIDGEHWIFDFGSSFSEAFKAYRVIRHYNMNQSCFVGRPGPSFRYLLTSGKAPEGGFPGEDSISFNPDTITVKKINGSWKVVDGKHRLFDFGDYKDEAYQAYYIIRKYRFTKSCYVGRSNTGFHYMRK